MFSLALVQHYVDLSEIASAVKHKRVSNIHSGSNLKCSFNEEDIFLNQGWILNKNKDPFGKTGACGSMNEVERFDCYYSYTYNNGYSSYASSRSSLVWVNYYACSTTTCWQVKLSSHNTSTRENQSRTSGN